jgi:hypothetical protein
MLPESIAIGACPHCGMALWVEEAKRLGEVDRWGSPIDPDHPSPAGWRKARQIATAAQRTVMALIEREPGPNPERLPCLHRKLWWLHNDPQRNRRRKPRSDASATPRAEFSANLRELLRLLDLDNRDDRITAAEIHRELREVQQTMTLPKGRFPKDYKAVVARIRGSRKAMIRSSRLLGAMRALPTNPKSIPPAAEA